MYCLFVIGKANREGREKKAEMIFLKKFKLCMECMKYCRDGNVFSRFCVDYLMKNNLNENFMGRQEKKKLKCIPELLQ